MKAGIFIGGPLDGQAVPKAALDGRRWYFVENKTSRFAIITMMYELRVMGNSICFGIAPDVTESVISQRVKSFS